MVAEKLNKYEEDDLLPIPSYDEAINARPSSSQSFLGPSEVSHDAERQGLLRGEGTANNGFRQPWVEDGRNSLDDIASSNEISRENSTEELRRELQQMDILEPGTSRDAGANRLGGSRLSKHLISLTHSLSSINLPFREWFPSWDYIKEKASSLSLQGGQINWIVICRLFALLMVVFLIYLLFVSDLFKLGKKSGRMPMDPEYVRAFVRDNINASSIREYSRYVTSFDHMAGTAGGLAQAQFIEHLFADSHLEDVGLERFEVYLNFPRPNGRRVAILEPLDLAWEAVIEEEMAYDDGRKQVPVFHGHAKAGDVTGPLIYANYGSRDDFEHLRSQGVNMNGSIALVRYGGDEHDQALKIHAADLAGSVGCIIYSDPADDGYIRGPAYPKGPFMPRDGVQRGAVSLMSWVLGDVLTPGYASDPGERKRNPVENNPGLNKIPSIPLAWRDAQKLLQVLKGHGMRMDDTWGAGGVPDMEWWTGDQSSPIVRLTNEQDEVERAPIYNVLGTITGIEQPEKSIILGNHHDAWCFGAGDPGSGTAVMLEVVRIFGQLRELGWRPLRTIQFASWDGGEYNMIGSTEHVEAWLADLRRDAFAYINVDVAAVGPEFKASSSPLLNTALLQVLERVPDPAGNRSLRTVFADKGSKIGGLDAGSDYAAFQDMAGTSSLDMTFHGEGYPSHSCYDNFDWMENFGDPGFEYHKAMAQIWALLILDLSDRELLPFDFQVYANSVAGYVRELEMYIAGKGRVLDMSSLNEAVEVFIENAREFNEWDQAWSNLVFGAGQGFESNTMAIKRISHNTRMANFETNLLDLEGGGVRPAMPFVL